MMVRAALLALGLAAMASASPLSPRQPVRCVSGLYILVARGSNQHVGEGSPGAVADAIAARVPNSVSQAIDYPAAIISLSSNYISSVNDGIKDTKTKIQEYVAACGSASRIALIGYSQGGNVMTDTLAGGIGKPDPIGDGYRKYIKAVVVFGDPRSNAGQMYSVGTAKKDGLFARRDSLAALNTWAGVLRSYCDEGDPFCASGLNLEVHYGEVKKYAQAATDFVVGLAK